MKTSKQLVAEVEAELNAVKAADLGLEAIEAFAQEALKQFGSGDVVKTKDALDNLASLAKALRAAVPANVTPASAGPVGKSAHEHYLEQASGVVQDSLEKLGEATVLIHEALTKASEAVMHANTATATIKSPDLKRSNG